MKMDILSALEHKFPSFSKGQRTIAQFILKNYDKAAFMTAARLGEVTGVSESTVVRFAADLGYRGYPGMKKALQEIVRNRLTSVERIEAAESTMDGHDVLKAVLRADINNLQATLDEVDQDNFDQAVDMILSAKHIYIIGMRTSTTLADFLGIYLKLLLDNVTVVKEIAARENGITCSCGSKDYGMEIHSTYVDLVCRSCGARLRIPAATDEDLDRLCCRMKLQIKSE